jgi:hypothetical protein
MNFRLSQLFAMARQMIGRNVVLPPLQQMTKSKILTASLPRTLFHIMHYLKWLQQAHHLSPAFWTAFWLCSFVFCNHFVFLACYGFVNYFAQQFGVAVVRNHLPHFIGEAGTGQRK